jgi:hypothetical protein
VQYLVGSTCGSAEHVALVLKHEISDESSLGDEKVTWGINSIVVGYHGRIS